MGAEFKSVRSVDQLDTESRYLVHKAKEATEHAYAPYSRLRVGTAALLDDGTLVTGSNQENASYPAGMCAERVALFACAAVHPGKKILRLALVARKQRDLVATTPCGFCRQVMTEFEARQRHPIELIMMDYANNWILVPSAISLLPHVFSVGQPPRDRKRRGRA